MFLPGSCEPLFNFAASLIKKEAGGDFSKYIDSENREEFAFQIEECLTNTKLRESMIIEGLRHAENFQPNKISKQLIDVYESLV